MEAKGVTGKIFWNKELAVVSESLERSVVKKLVV
jgi:hypothetical protein